MKKIKYPRLYIFILCLWDFLSFHFILDPESVHSGSWSAKAKSSGSDRIRIHATAPPLPKKSSPLQWNKVSRFITTSPWSPALKKDARHADLKGENQLEVEGWIAGGRVNGAEAEVLASVLRGRLAQDPA